MPRVASAALAAVFFTAIPFSSAVAQHCSPDWTAAYRCMNGCGGCPANRGNGGGRAPYVPPAPTPEQLAAQRAHDLNEKGIVAFKAGDFVEAAKLLAEAAEAAPGDSNIALNLSIARDRLKAQGESAARHDAIVQRLDRLSSDLSNSAAPPPATGLDFMGASSDTPDAGSKPMRGPSTLPKSVEDAIASGYSEEPPGVSERVRKGFQAIATHDWKAARAWFQDALNHDPQNAGIKRLAELADFTLRWEQSGTAKSSSASSAVQLPESADMQFLFPGADHPSGKTQPLELPKESDLVFLFPGLPSAQATELSDFTERYWISRIETDHQLIHADPRSAQRSSTAASRN